MSEVTSATTANHDTPDGVLNGTLGKETGVTTTVDVEGGEEEEESDDYDEDEEADYEEERQVVGDEDDDEEEEEEEGEANHQGTNTLTHLLIGNPNAPVDGDDIDDEEDEEDEDEEYAEDQDEVAPPSSKKRGIDEVADEDDSQGAKKVKA